MDLKQLEKISEARRDINGLRILADTFVAGGSLQCAQIMNVTELAQRSVRHPVKTLTEAALPAPEKEGRGYTYPFTRNCRGPLDTSPTGSQGNDRCIFDATSWFSCQMLII